MTCIVCSRHLTADDATVAITVTVGSRHARWDVCPDCQRVGHLTEAQTVALLTGQVKAALRYAVADGARDGRHYRERGSERWLRESR